MSANGSSPTLEQHEDRLLWIFGSSRSGSTWLLRMLADFDGVVPIDDPHIGHHLGVWRPIPLAWAAASDECPPELSTLLELKAAEPGYFFAERHRESWWQPLRALIQARFEAQAADVGLDQGSGPSAYVVKEPGSHVAPLLAELFPDSKLVFLLRDGRDVVDSWLAAHQDGSWAIRGGAFPVAPDGRVPLIRWLSSVWSYRTRAVLEAFESRAPRNRLLIRYEEMREAPAESLRPIAEMAGLDTARVAEVTSAHAFEKLPASSRGPLKETRLAEPGAWRRNLSREEKAAMHEVLGETLGLVGYEVDEALTAA
jgi:hypothetical protein